MLDYVNDPKELGGESQYAAHNEEKSPASHRETSPEAARDCTQQNRMFVRLQLYIEHMFLSRGDFKKLRLPWGERLSRIGMAVFRDADIRRASAGLEGMIPQKDRHTAVGKAFVLIFLGVFPETVALVIF